MSTQRVLKYAVLLTRRFAIELPRTATVLRVDWQYDDMQMWALVTDDEESVRREFFFVATGQVMPSIEGANRPHYITTMISRDGGSAVFHLFEVRSTSGGAYEPPPLVAA